MYVTRCRMMYICTVIEAIKWWTYILTPIMCIWYRLNRHALCPAQCMSNCCPLYSAAWNFVYLISPKQIECSVSRAEGKQPPNTADYLCVGVIISKRKIVVYKCQCIDAVKGGVYALFLTKLIQPEAK